MNKLIMVGQLDTSDGTREQANRIYSVGGLAPCISTCGGGQTPENLRCDERTRGGQTLEPRPDQCTNTITSVTKDNLIVEALDNEQNNLFKP